MPFLSSVSCIALITPAAVEPDVEVDRARALEQAVQVGVEADQPALDETQPLPHTVTQRET